MAKRANAKMKRASKHSNLRGGIRMKQALFDAAKATSAPVPSPHEKAPAAALPPFQVADEAVRIEMPDSEAVRSCAYAKWEAAGRPMGDGTAFWLEAERELQSRRST